MKWTTEKPTEPGWYWYRDSNIGTIMVGIKFIGENYGVYAYAVPRLSDLGEWYGPIPEPEE